MAVPNTLGIGVGLPDKGAIDANFTTLVNGGGYSTLNGVTAHAGGGQTNGVLMSAAINRVTTVGSAGDSVILPSAVGGQSITVINGSGTSMNVFSNTASTSDTINGTAGTTAYAIAGGKTAEFVSPASGVWHALLSA
jgi:hypothetical protein